MLKERGSSTGQSGQGKGRSEEKVSEREFPRGRGTRPLGSAAEALDSEMALGCVVRLIPIVKGEQ